MKVALNIPDCHVPWHDQKAWEIMLLVATDQNKLLPITQINIMGDFADFYWFSLHDKLPSAMSVKETLKDEIYQCIKKLEELRKLFPDAEINFVEGNHEFRMVRYIVKKCPELYELFTLPELLQFDRLSINYIPFGRHQLHRVLDTDLYMRHQPFNGGKNCASSTAHNKGISLLFGHTHRKQSYTFKRADGKSVTCISGGWLGDVKAPVFDYVDSENWAQSFSFVFSHGKGDWHIHEIDIKNHKAVYNGYIYEN